MKERPILFSAPMVRALLDGTKSQTRRIMKPQPTPVPNRPTDHWWPCNAFQSMVSVSETRAPDAHGMAGDACPYGAHGEHLWVRETHRPIFGQTCGLIAVDYRADLRDKWERLGDAPDSLVRPTKWVPSIHMRREYSRILLEIVSVRVEQLLAISEADAQAEGVDPATCVHEFYDGYAKLWESINGAGSWAANPWMWVINFKPVTP